MVRTTPPAPSRTSRSEVGSPVDPAPLATRHLHGLRMDTFDQALKYLTQREPAAFNGTDEEALHQARDAIEGRPDLSPAQKADHLAVLWFVAEAEEVPVRAMKAYITEKQLMASALYQEIF